MRLDTLPAAFLSHGSPMFALEPGTTGPAFARWGDSLRRPTAPGAALHAVLIMSPHWATDRPTVMTTATPATWHDFGGFPPALYALQYPAPGAPGVGEEAIALLQGAGLPVARDAQRPLDHGAWVPLMHLFPAADVPVVQISLPQSASPADVFALGQALRPLRSQGVLLLGSGSMTHNLSEFFSRNPAGDTGYVQAFSRWVEDALTRGDTAALLEYRRQAPGALQAHPEEDHLLPMFFALGAADDGAVPAYLSREVQNRFLAMDSFVLASPV